MHVVDAEPRCQRHEVAVERRRHDHDPVALGAVPREPFEHLGSEPSRAQRRRRTPRRRRATVGGGPTGEQPADQPSFSASRSPSRPRRRASSGDARARRAVERDAARDRGEERHQGVARAMVPSKSNAATGARSRATPRVTEAGGGRRRGARGAGPTSRIAACAGAHTVSEPRPSPATIAAATASGSVASGAGVEAVGHLRVDEPGPDDEDADAAALQAVAESLAERVEAGLARAVDEVRLPGPLAGDRRQHDDPAVALAAHRLRQRDEHRHRTGVVGLDDPDRLGARRSRRRPGRRARRTRRVRGRCRRSARRPTRTNAAWVSRARASNSTHSTVVAPSASSSLAAGANDSGSRPASTTVRHRLRTSARGRERDVGAPAEDEGRLHRAERVVHVVSLSESEPAGEVRGHRRRRDRAGDGPPAIRGGAGT